VRLRDRRRKFQSPFGDDDAGYDVVGRRRDAAAGDLIWNGAVALFRKWNINSDCRLSARGHRFGDARSMPSEHHWEDQMRKSILALAASIAALTGLVAPAVAEGERFVLVSHAPDSDSWWNTIKNAIQIAGEQMDVTVESRNPPTGDLADMARIIEQASASSPDG